MLLYEKVPADCYDDIQDYAKAALHEPCSQGDSAEGVLIDLLLLVDTHSVEEQSRPAHEKQEAKRGVYCRLELLYQVP